MTDFDSKAADALKNFTDDVARARELLRKEQARLKEVEKFIAQQRQQLTNLDGQCREAAVRCEALEGQKSKADRCNAAEYRDSADELSSIAAPDLTTVCWTAINQTRGNQPENPANQAGP